jgi:hypothetical protein
MRGTKRCSKLNYRSVNKPSHADRAYDPNDEKDRVFVGVLRSHAKERDLSIKPPSRRRHKKFTYWGMGALDGRLPCLDLAFAGVISPLL